MRLVSGESLEAKIKTAGTLAQRLALLPHAIAATDALAYAHAQGIIHRDLKPANVMLGDFGETVVIDWGLAKDLRAPPEPATGRDHRAGALSGTTSAATVAGDVIGTPTYMPPEQARGADVDERADVYALGAMLYHLLAGVPPFRGPADRVLTQVLAGPPPALAALVPEAPPDLLAIVARAMATLPEDRYASAAELGAELKRFQRGKLVSAHQYTAWELVRRWLRRRRAVVAVIAIAVAVLAIGAVISVRRIVREEQRVRSALALAEQHHAEAERRRADTERLLDFMVFRLHGKLEPIGRLDVLADLADTLREHYASHADPRGAEEVRRRAISRRNLGDVLRGKGDSTAALVEYRAAAGLLEGVPGDASPDVALGSELVTCKLAIAEVLGAHGDASAAFAALREAEAVVARGLVAAPGDASWRGARSRVALARGILQVERGQLAEALESYRAGCADARAVAAALDDVASKRAVSLCHDRVGEVLAQRGEHAAALHEYRAALAIDSALSAAAPDDARLASDLRFSYVKVGQALLRTGERARALAMYRSALAIARALVERDPENAQWLRLLATSHVRIGDALAAPDTAQAALEAYRAGLAIRRDLAARDPSNAEWQHDLFAAHTKAATMLEGTEQLTAAIAAYEAARVIGERLLSNEGMRTMVQRELLLSLSGLGRSHAGRGDRAQALRWHRAELAIAELLIAGGNGDVLPQDYWAAVFAHQAIAELLVAQRDRTGARAGYDAALALARRRVVEDADDPDWKVTVAELEAARGRLRTR